MRRSHQATPMMEPLECRRLLTVASPADETSEHLTRLDVERILGRAGSQALDKQIIAVVDRQGSILGVYGGSAARNVDRTDTRKINGLAIPAQNLLMAIARARTAAFFQSTQEAFTTRSAR